jgi:SAM-dependent methyltransferase
LQTSRSFGIGRRIRGREIVGEIAVAFGDELLWSCLECRERLSGKGDILHCSGCGKTYPVLGGISILVRHPGAYLRAEFESVARAAQDAERRIASLDTLAARAGLPNASLDRHRDVLDAEAAQAQTLLALMVPPRDADNAKPSVDARRSGWKFDALVPYLLRDWTDTDEFAAAQSVIADALKKVIPDPSGKSIVFAGCGAAGLLAGISPDFGHVVGFDLTLPVLCAARHLLEGETIALAMPRAMNAQGRIALRGRKPLNNRVQLAAMDAFDTAFADGSIDCVVTSFFLDLVPDPRGLAREIHRVLARDGVWINYGPSGPLNGLWRFDETESEGFVESAGFRVLETAAHRASYLDLSRDCPSWSFRSHVCYLTAAQKTGERIGKSGRPFEDVRALPETIPEHFPGAVLVRRQRLGVGESPSILLRHEKLPGATQSFELGHEAAEHLALVDGKRMLGDITAMLQTQDPTRTSGQILGAFARYFAQGLIARRGDRE